MIVCAGRNEYIKGAFPVGVGLIESAINLTKYLEKNSPKEITFVASAGSYGNYKPFDIVVSCKASQIEHSFFFGGSYTPLDLIYTNVSCETSIIVNSSNYITNDKDVSKQYLQKDIQLENMEFFSLVSVAKIYGIKAKGIFVVTNYCDENAHKDFLKNHKKAKEIMEQIVEQYR